MGTKIHFSDDDELPIGSVSNTNPWLWPFVHEDAAVVQIKFKLRKFTDSAKVKVHPIASSAQQFIGNDEGTVLVTATANQEEVALYAIYGAGTYGSGTYGNFNP